MNDLSIGNALIGLVVALIMWWWDIRARRREADRVESEDDQRKAIFTEIDLKFANSTAELKKFFSEGIKSVEKKIEDQYITVKEYGPLKNDVVELRQVTADHAQRLARLEAEHDSRSN